MILFKNANELIKQLERFFDTIDQGILVFKEGVSNYVYEKTENFDDNIRTLSKLESTADEIRRDIEDRLYTRSLMPQVRGDILKLLEAIDDIIDILKKNLYQFDIEMPNIPTELHLDFFKLTET